MSAKSKSKEQQEIDQLTDRLADYALLQDDYDLLKTEVRELGFLNKLLDNDLQIARGLLQESIAQLGKTNDEYHSDLRDKIIKEIGE